jgi:hypothetical protein
MTMLHSLTECIPKFKNYFRVACLELRKWMSNNIFYHSLLLQLNSSYSLFPSPPFRINSSSLFPMIINLKKVILWTVSSTPWAGHQPCPKATAYTGQNKHETNKDKQPCLEWGLNRRSQCLSWRKHFKSQTAWPLWSALVQFYAKNIIMSDSYVVGT